MTDFIRQSLFWLIPLVLVFLALKAYALWKAGNHKQGVWFFFLFVINSAGILPLLYLLFFQKKREK